ncbi:MAG: hypothetical protein AAB405_02500 [Patescibacteria group bacterium]
MNQTQNNLIKELGLDNLPSEKQMEILLDVGRIIQQNVVLRVFDELNERDKDEFDKLLGEKSGDEEAVLAFLRSKIKNLDGIVEEETAKFKQGSVDLMKNVKA